MSKIFEEDELLLTKEEQASKKTLILFNDEDNSFDWVIQSLVDVCQHDSVQAEQCTIIAHNRGKCDIKYGEINKLEPMAHRLLDRGLTVEIE